MNSTSPAQDFRTAPLDARGAAAVALVLADAWKRFVDRDGRLSFGIPAGSKPGLYYRTSDNGCTCPDIKYRPWLVCKHMLAVRLQLELEAPEYAF